MKGIMIINTNSWHYKVYSFTYFLSSPPKQTNLCQYVRRFLYLPFWAVLMLILALCLALIVACAFLLGPVFGYVPRSWNPFKFFDSDAMVQYQGLRLGKSYNAFQLYPWHAVLILGVMALHCAIYHYAGSAPLIMEAKVVGGVVGVIAAILGFLVYCSSDAGQVVEEYLSAKKQKICPVVEFKSSKE